MYSVRSLKTAASFNIPGAPHMGTGFHQGIDAGATRLEWCFVISQRDQPIGRLGLRSSPTCPAQFLGQLPQDEVFVFGLSLPWEDPEVIDVGELLLAHVFSATGDSLPASPQAVVNAERNSHSSKRVAIFERSGMTLFQEKQGFGWGPEDEPRTDANRLHFITLEAAGVERYRRVLERAGEDTIDRSDSWYREMAGGENWAGVFMTLCAAGDRETWLLASTHEGEDVGVVAVSTFADETATITFIGVVPEQRGNGYVNDLLGGGTNAAKKAGFTAMVSDADVINTPMTDAFRRNGHRADHRPWHKWHYRLA